MSSTYTIRRRVTESRLISEDQNKLFKTRSFTQTPNEIQINSNSSQNFYRPWEQETPLEDLKRSVLGVRTDFTYGDSGSYRSDVSNMNWRTPDMSRLPLKSSINHIESTLSYNHSNLSINSAIDMKSKIETNRELDYDEDISSRYSDASSTNSYILSSRVLRSLTKRKQNNDNKTVNEQISLQRNTNSLIGTDQLGDGAELSNDATPTLTDRTRKSRKSERITKTQTISRHSSNRTSKVDTQDLNPPHLSSSSTTYVYTYVPQTSVEHTTTLVSKSGQDVALPPVSGDGPGQTNNPWGKKFSLWSQKSTNDRNEVDSTSTHSSDHRQQSEFQSNTSGGWLARHIFGLEKPEARPRPEVEPSSSQFISSDMDEDDDYLNGLSRQTRRRVGRNQKMYSPQKSSQSVTQRSVSLLSHCFVFFQYLLTIIREVSIQALAFLLASVYSLGNVFLHVLKTVPRLSSWLFWKLFNDRNETSLLGSEGQTLHPRLSNFYGHAGSAGSYVDDDEEVSYDQSVTNNIHKTRNALIKSTCRLLGWTCLLLPLILFLAFLFGPVDDKQSANVYWPIYITDKECELVLSEIRPKRTQLWNIVKWRSHCFYVRYLLTDSSETNKQSGSESSTWTWIPFYSWFKYGKKSNEFDLSHKIDDNTAIKLSEQLSSFSQSINQRLDILSRSLQSTDSRLTTLTETSTNQLDLFKSQIVQLQNQLNNHVNNWNEFINNYHLTDKPSEQISSNIDPRAIYGIESERLLKAAIDAANQTIFIQLQELRSELNQNATILNTSLVLAGLRSQLGFRLKRTQDELQKLRLQLAEKFNMNSKSNIKLESDINSLRVTMDNLILRLSNLEKLNSETEVAFANIKKELKECNGNELNMKQCRTNIDKQLERIVTNLTQVLTIQMNDNIQNFLSSQLKDPNVNNVFIGQLKEIVSVLTKESVEKFVRENQARYIPENFANEVVFQQIIDEALRKYAADRTGMADFALESSGGSIVGTRCTRSYTEGASLFSIFGLPLARLSNSPRTILQPGNNPGDCWPFHGSTGEAVIRLSSPIIIKAVSLEHLPRALAPNGKLDSAPREFSIKALDSEYDEEGKILGTFVYDIDGLPIQTFTINDYEKPVQFIEFIVLSNHGHPKYTCVYRLRVHGQMIT